jgi:hypothetical protein
MKKIRWEWTSVPASVIERDEDGAFVTLQGNQHYIAERVEGLINEKGVETWDVRWEDSFIYPDQMDEPKIISPNPRGRLVSRRRVRLPPAAEPPGPARSVRQRSLSVYESIESTPAYQASYTSPISTRSSTSEDILPVHRLRFTPRYSDQAYNVAARIRTALEQDEMIGTTGVPRQVVARWTHKRYRIRPRRPIRFNASFVGRGKPFNGRDPRRAEAALVQEIGHTVTEPCSRCKDGKGCFVECVVMDDFGRGECTNCKFSDKSRFCSFHVECK